MDTSLPRRKGRPNHGGAPSSASAVPRGVVSPQRTHVREPGGTWLDPLPVQLRAKVLDACTSSVRAEGEVIYSPGDSPARPNDGFFIVVSGTLKASLINDDGEEHTVYLITERQAFGAISLLQGTRRSLQVSCLSPVELRVLSAARFDELMNEADFAQAVAKLAAMRVQTMLRLRQDGMGSSMVARMARRLLLLAQDDLPDGPVLHRRLAVSQEALARMLGTSRQWTALQLQALRNAQVIAQHYGGIELVSIDALRRAAKG